MKHLGVFICFNLCLLELIHLADSASASASNEGIVRLIGSDEVDAGGINVTDAEAVADETPNGAEGEAEAVADEMQNDAAVNDANNVGDDYGAINDDSQSNDKAIDDENQNNQPDVSGADESGGGVNTENVADANDEVPGGKDDDSIADQNNILPSDNADSPGVTPDKTGMDPVFKFSKAEIKKFKLWPEAKVPYFIDEFSYDKVLRDKIRGYLDYASQHTAVIFYELMEPPADENERWVFFVNRRGQLDCKDYSHKSFTVKGVQKVVVGYDCLKHGGPMAAIVLALLGVPPQHNAPDRDKYITVNEKHIIPEKRGLFNRLNNDEWLFHGMQYDYESVSHYPKFKYTVDGHETITLKTGFHITHKNSQDLSFPSTAITDKDERTDYSHYDLYKIAQLYMRLRYSRADKGNKLEDCESFYRPGAGFLYKELPDLPERPKPKQYLSAVKKLYGPKDIMGETLSSLEDF